MGSLWQGKTYPKNPASPLDWNYVHTLCFISNPYKQLILQGVEFLEIHKQPTGWLSKMLSNCEDV